MNGKEKEKSTDVIYLKIPPSIKEAAKYLALEDGRTLSGYIIELIKREIKSH